MNVMLGDRQVLDSWLPSAEQTVAFASDLTVTVAEHSENSSKYFLKEDFVDSDT
jgi:hypothetical protein